MYTRHDADQGQQYAAQKKEYTDRQKYAAPEGADQKDRKYMAAGKRLSAAVSGNQRFHVIYFIWPGTVEDFPDPAHGQKEKGRDEQKREKAFILQNCSPAQQNRI